MGFHSRSVVGFGQLLNRMTGSLTDGSPVSDALRVVRDHFDAMSVTLEIERRSQGLCASFSSETCETGPVGERPRAIAAVDEHVHHIVAREAGTDDSVEYAMGLSRDRAAAPFDQEEIALAQICVAQIARSLDLASRIDSSAVEKALYSDALDKLNIGVIALHSSARVVSLSNVAERFLNLRDGLQVQAGKLRAASAAEDRELQAAIRGAAQGGPDGVGASRGLALTKRSGARSLGVMIRPLAGASAPVAVYLRDCDTAPDVESEFVRQIFDLTPAEAAVTRRLTAGLSLEDAANSLDISRNTARAHLRSIFSKSGITRQTELVRLVLNSAAMLGARSQASAA